MNLKPIKLLSQCVRQFVSPVDRKKLKPTEKNKKYQHLPAIQMETEVDKEILKSAGAELLPDGRKGLRIHDWEIETIRGTILTSLAHEQ